MTNDERAFTGYISGEMYVAIIDHHPHAREPSWRVRVDVLTETADRVAVQRPLKEASRFSRNASIPSFVSSVLLFTACAIASASSASLKLEVNELLSSRFVIDSARVGPRDSRTASSSTAASSSSSGTTRLT